MIIKSIWWKQHFTVHNSNILDVTGRPSKVHEASIHIDFIVLIIISENSEAAIGGVLQEKVFLQILQNSQANTCARVSFLIKLQAQDLQIY